MKTNQKRILSFRTTILLLLGLVTIAFIVVSFFALRASLNAVLLRMETAYFTERAHVISDAVHMELQATQARTEDLALWEETVRFVQARSADEDGVPDASDSLLQYNEYDYLYIQDAAGRMLLGVRLFGQADAAPMSVSLARDMAPLAEKTISQTRAQALAGNPLTLPGASGIMLSGDTLYSVAFSTILSGGENNQPIGVIALGRRLNNTYLQKLTHFDEYTFSFLSNGQDGGRDIAIARIDNSTARLSFALETVDDSHIVLQIDAPRVMYSESQAVQRTTMLIFTGLMIALVFILYGLIMRKIIRPMERLSMDIHTLSAQQSGALDVRKYGDSKEHVSLVTAINNLVDGLLESRMSLSIFDHILNGMNVYLYVSDPFTGTVLFVNDKMREHFHITQEIVGQPCWTLLQDQETDRCKFCPLPELMRDPDRMIIWEEQNKATGRYYRNTDSIIDWLGGRKAHLHHRVEITDLKETEFALTKRMMQQQLMAEITQGFIVNRNMDDFIVNTLQAAGEFIDAGRVLIARIDPDTMQSALAYEWVNPRQPLQPIGSGFVSYRPGMLIYDELIVRGADYLAIDDLQQTQPGQSHIIRDGIRALLGMPIRVNRQLWGIMNIGIIGGSHEWSQSDIHLFTMIASIISAVVDRSASEASLIRMSSIVESSPDYISYINGKGEYEYLNNGASLATGYSREELMDAGMSLLYDADTMRRIQDDLLPAVRNKEKASYEFPIIRKDGQARLMQYSVFPIASQDDGAGVIGSDITEQRQLERDLVQAKEQAEQSNLAKSDFLSRMSHEMRTPMNAIIGMTNMAKNTADPEKKEYCLDKIDEASSHLLGVINDILDMSKIEANKFDLSESEFSFERMIHKIAGIINFRVEEKHQNLIVDIDDSIPQTIVADEQRLAQVITNLLSNATKFTPEEGSIRLTVRKEHETEADLTMRFDVTDTGVGVSPEQQSRLFHAFEQGDGSVSRRFGGTGLGLAISKRIVNLMGGDIWVNSIAGEGATFSFTIVAQRGQKTSPRRMAGMDLSHLHILAVDGADEIRNYFLTLAARHRIACDVAADRGEALHRLQNAQEPYQIVFIDSRIGDGTEALTLARWIASEMDESSIVLMAPENEWNELAAELGDIPHRFVAKPLFASALVDCLSQTFVSMDHEPVAVAVNASSHARYDGYRVLLAEDIQINREIVIALLEEIGIETDIAEDGMQALTMFARDPERYDLIFMDIHMPEIDGYEATRRIRALDIPEAQAVPIVAMTANVFREDVERCLAAGMNDHIGKPIDVDEFYAKLEKNLPKKELV